MTNPDIAKAGELTQFNAKRQPAKNGRPSGSRDTLSRIFIEDFVAVWRRDGRTAIERVALTDPSTLVRVAASLQPKELQITTPESKLTDEQIDQYYEVLAQRLAEKAQRAEAQLAATPTQTEAVN